MSYRGGVRSMTYLGGYSNQVQARASDLLA